MNPFLRASLAAPAKARMAAFGVAALAVLALVYFGLQVPLLAGLLAFSLVTSLARRAPRVLGRRRGVAMTYAIATVVVLICALLSGIGLGLHLTLRDGAGLHELLDRMADIVASARSWLPETVSSMLPQSAVMFGEAVVWLKSHAAEVGGLSLDAAKETGYAFLGVLLGILVAASPLNPAKLGPIARLLAEQAAALRLNFWRVATAQIKISGLNTALTALYLLVILPSFGVHLPLSKTMVTFTFVAGLLPVVGNLISNSVITVISLGHSPGAAAASLAFLIGIHKLEYFLNARIVGGHINARAWEILLTMIVFERLFGLRGVVIAPIFYAWLKSEWSRWDVAPAAPLRPVTVAESQADVETIE